jgi:hypothetical protein
MSALTHRYTVHFSKSKETNPHAYALWGQFPSIEVGRDAVNTYFIVGRQGDQGVYRTLSSAGLEK